MLPCLNVNFFYKIIASWTSNMHNMYHNISRTLEDSRGWALPVAYKRRPWMLPPMVALAMMKTGQRDELPPPQSSSLGTAPPGSVPGPTVTDSLRSANAYIRRQVCHRERQRPLSRTGLPDEHAATRSFLCDLFLSFRPVFRRR